MIKFKTLAWSNAFSYGENNQVNFLASPLTQIVGKNGHGKSSIALILEEVLYNTNSKKIKKGDILNRYINGRQYTICLTFSKDGDDYEVHTTRTATSSTVRLLRNSIDISSHTATGTYKSIEHIIGYDHKTFSQIVYQSSVGSLEFLTATDTARKKFLIELLNLSIYTKAADVFKDLASGVSKQLDAAQAKATTIKSWLAKYEDADLTIRELEEEIPAPTGLQNRVAFLKDDLLNIETTNRKITQNNAYKQILAGININPQSPVACTPEALLEAQIKLDAASRKLKEGKALSGTQMTLTCKTCAQPIDNSTRYNLAQEFEKTRAGLEATILELEQDIKQKQATIAAANKHQQAVAEWEKYYALIDKDLQDQVLDADEIRSDIKVLEADIVKFEKLILQTRAKNKQAAEHNAKVSVIVEQLKDMKEDLKLATKHIVDLTGELTTLQVLVKSFSTTGLVAYKIECLVKDLEELTNQYLAVLADGRFQLSFKIASSDKLNVVITDNGRDIDISALSSGERARVNVATLLAIRKLMQSLSNSRTNLLILDETVENLDAEGKERLIEVLLEEENLNTFLISHGFSHPLLEKLNVFKEHNISRIE